MKFLFVLPILASCVFATLDTEWWKHTSVYHVIPSTFKDSNGDGIGDIQGIISKLDYFQDLKIETLLLSVHYTSPIFDTLKYKSVSYTDVNPDYGTIEDFEELIQALEERGMKLILDLELNHATRKHIWFQQSQNRTCRYSDYFVWADAKYFLGIRFPPNNWKSTVDDKVSAWTWDNTRSQYYLHQFLPTQPDLNLSNSIVKQEVKNILQFWLDKGVHGFRLSSVRYYIEDEDLRDNSEGRFDRTEDQPETFELIHELREFLDEYNQQIEDGYAKILLAEARKRWGYTHFGYYDGYNMTLAHFSINYNLGNILRYSSLEADDIEYYIHRILSSIPEGATPNWLTEDTTFKRIGSAQSPEHIDLANVLLMALPGVPVYYYGQELGLTNNWIRYDQEKDYTGRDNFRYETTRPSMPWDGSLNAGFSSTSNETYLPVNADYLSVNLQKQANAKYSHYKLFKTLSQIRQYDAFKSGNLSTYVLSRWIMALTRVSDTNDTYVVVINIGPQFEPVDLSSEINDLPKYLEVVTTSTNCLEYKEGDFVPSGFYTDEDTFVLRPLSSVVLYGKPQSSAESSEEESCSCDCSSESESNEGSSCDCSSES